MEKTERRGGRPKTGVVNDITISVTVNKDWLAEVHAVCGDNRTEWIRETCFRAAKRAAKKKEGSGDG